VGLKVLQDFGDRRFCIALDGWIRDVASGHPIQESLETRLILVKPQQFRSSFATQGYLEGNKNKRWKVGTYSERQRKTKRDTYGQTTRTRTTTVNLH